MTLFDRRKEKLINELKNKKYRDAFASEHIDTGIPFQIKALREQRNWTQVELGKHAKMNQVRISVLEDPNYAKFTISTLKRLASAFDIGLVVRFAPISELVEWDLNLSSESLKALSFDDDPYFKEKVKAEDISIQSNLQEQLSQSFACTNVSDISDWRKKRKESHLAKLFEPGQPQKIVGARP